MTFSAQTKPKPTSIDGDGSAGDVKRCLEGRSTSNVHQTVNFKRSPKQELLDQNNQKNRSRPVIVQLLGKRSQQQRHSDAWRAVEYRCMHSRRSPKIFAACWWELFLTVFCVLLSKIFCEHSMKARDETNNKKSTAKRFLERRAVKWMMVGMMTHFCEMRVLRVVVMVGGFGLVFSVIGLLMGWAH